MKIAFFILFAATQTLPALAVTREFGWDRPGFDYTSFDLSTNRFVLCEWKCDQDRRCKAWTYVNPGVQGPRARCWLKWKVPRAVPNANCVSGTK